MRSACRGVLATAIAAALVTAGPAHGQKGGKEEAKYHFDQGVKLYKKDDFSGALAEFLKAYDVAPHYSVLYNIASCQMELESYLDALGNFERYFAEGGDAISGGRRAEVEEKIVELEGLLSKVKIEVDQEGATIVVDGHERGVTPHEALIFLDAGTHSMSIEKEGFETYVEEFILSRSESASFRITLEPIARPGEQAVKEPAVEEPAAVESVVEPVYPAGGGRRKIGPGAFRGMMITSAVLFAGSIVTFGGLLHDREQYRSCHLSDPDCFRPYERDIKALALATDVLWIAGAAVGLAGLVLIAFTDFHRKERRDVALSPLLGPDGGGLVLSGSF
jgi:hypothetical protein